jgi:hypothetical protein
MEKTPSNSSSFAASLDELEPFIQERFAHIEGSQSGSFETFWTGCEAEFPSKPYSWRKELCLHMIERMLREDRCRLWHISNKLGTLPADENDNWNEPLDVVMHKLRDWWGRYENQPIDIHKPDGFDTLYFVEVIPPVEWPPYGP